MSWIYYGWLEQLHWEVEGKHLMTEFRKTHIHGKLSMFVYRKLSLSNAAEQSPPLRALVNMGKVVISFALFLLPLS